MAQTKLTLRLDADLISRAKASAAKQGKSLSQIVADYFAALVGSPRRPRRKRPDRDALAPQHAASLRAARRRDAGPIGVPAAS